jgi:hypothetical protein
METKNRLILLAVLAAFGVGLIAGYVLVTGDLIHGEDTSIFVSTGNVSSTEDDSPVMNLQFQQQGQLVGEVNIPLGQQTQSKPVGESSFEVDVPVDISGNKISNLMGGDVLFCEEGASLVLLDSTKALFLDFGLDECEIDSYTKAGPIGDEIKEILSDDVLSLWEKQSAIWYVQGLDAISLNVTWQNNVGEGFKEAFEGIKGRSSSVQPLQDADVRLEFESEGYSRVKLEILENKKTQSLLVERGFALENENKGNQNLAFGESILVYLPEGESKEFFIRSYCINAGRGVPSNRDELVMWKKVPENVQEVIDQNYITNQVASGAGQSDVWGQTG